MLRINIVYDVHKEYNGSNKVIHTLRSPFSVFYSIYTSLFPRCYLWCWRWFTKEKQSKWYANGWCSVCICLCVCVDDWERNSLKSKPLCACPKMKEEKCLTIWGCTLSFLLLLFHFVPLFSMYCWISQSVVVFFFWTFHELVSKVASINDDQVLQSEEKKNVKNGKQGRKKNVL